MLLFVFLFKKIPPPPNPTPLLLISPLTWCFFCPTWLGAGLATEFINLVLYVFSVWLCVHIRWLDWPSCYTTLAWVRHCFPSHYPRSGQRSLQGGNVTRRIARWAFQDGHLVSFYLFFFSFWFVSFHTFPCCPLSTVFYLEKKKQYCLISSVVFLYLLFWFVVLIIVQPPTPLSLFCYSCSLCVIEFCPGCYGIPVGCVSHMGC